VAGIAFSVLFAVALALVQTAIPADADDAGEWLAFLSFVGVARDRAGEAEIAGRRGV
jgi:hypothetical protein